MLYLNMHPERPQRTPSLRREGDVAIALQRIVKGPRAVYLVRAIVASKAMTLLLDTGAGVSGIILDTQRATALGVSTQHDRVTMGAFSADTVDLELWNLSNVRRKYRRDGFPTIDGVLGSALLRKYGARIDFARDTLYLQLR
jgi:hypothetical protein